ncbi:ankyrin [Sphaerulina musiva SO2202]|uniref:Ankyrin n=1 Tax=Sphaerulina musiva (strain SO2202) TaxID=692275 RepID=M3CD46_SPHMS|nr:ankyrin [Sphaerulina musiva SO2202]EMF10986.1 ankyrin [Sphaerulina musiva SO2202]
MAEIKPEDLKSAPWHYQSSRPIFDVLIGQDTALPLLEASSTGNLSVVQNFLQDSPSIALESPHRIYMEDHPPAASSASAQTQTDNITRQVHARKISNINRAIYLAAEKGHVEIISTLLEFASRNNLPFVEILDREGVKAVLVLQNGHAAAAILDLLATKVDPSVVSHNDIHPTLRPIDFAIKSSNEELVKVILRHGGGGRAEEEGGRGISPRWSYSSLPYKTASSRLCEAARRSPQITKLLIEEGNYPVTGSGALQAAARSGGLETIRLLVEEYQADVNEVLSAETLHVARQDVALYASWTPMHFAASLGKEEAMRLLEGYGARGGDVRDVHGKTPWQVLEEWRGKFGGK